MATITRYLGLLLFATVCFGMVAAEKITETPVMTETTQQVVASSNRFAFKLFDQVIEKAGDNDNVFISPMSVAYALTMTLNGADGGTRAAIATTLELPELANAEINAGWKNFTEGLLNARKDVIFTIANSIWYRQGLPISSDFVELDKTTFNAEVRELDFGSPGAADIINAWVSDNTNDKITNIVSPPVDPSTIMFLINAIYFKGNWTYQFDKNLTRDYPFHAPGGDVSCRMMRITDHFRYFENDTLQAIYLPYGEKRFGMTVFLPKPPYTVDDITPALTDQAWSIGHSGFHGAKINLMLPRFKFDFALSLNRILEAMGMAIAFNSSDADFSKMLTPGVIRDRNVFISNVQHKTFLQVDEEGTEAAAVTSVEMALTSARPDPVITMTVDRPFLFAITDDMFASVIFIGRVVEPVWTE